MKKRSLFLVLALTLVMSFGLGGIVSSATVMRIGTIQNLDHPHHKALERFAELVSEKTAGTIKVQIFPMSQLGNAMNQIQSVKMGTLEAFIDGLGWYGQLVEEFHLFDTAYVFDSAQTLEKVLSGPIGQELIEDLIKGHGIGMLSMTWLRAPRHLLSIKPVKTVKDVAGMKLRIPESPSYVVPWKTLGASPTPIAFGETYLALQQKIVEAMECPLDMIYTQKFYEVAKYISLTGHLIEPAGFCVNQKWFQGLTSSQRQALIDSVNEAGIFNNELTMKMEADYKKKLEDAGVEFITVDKAAFMEAVKNAPKELEAKGTWRQGFYDEVLAFLGTITE